MRDVNVKLGDPLEPCMWARHWPYWDLHDWADYEADVAYWRGFQAGRESFAAELMPWVRWALASVPCDIALLDPDELAEVEQLLRGDIKDLMSRAIRRVEQARARAEADAAAAMFGDDPVAAV